MRMYAGHQLGRAERLNNIIVRSNAEAAYFIDIFFFCRYHQDWDILFPADASANFKSIHPGEHQIQQDQVIILLKRGFQAAFSVELCIHLIAVGLQVITLKLRNVFIILNN